jgi:hypothetical protein
VRDEDILEACRAIRPHLGELLGADLAEAVDRELAGLLARAEAGEKVENAMLGLLTRHGATREWTAHYLRSQEAGAADAERGYSPLPGTGSAISLDRYACPEGDYEWFREDVDDPIPRCPAHDISLVPAP